MQTDLAPFNSVNRDPEVMRFLRDGHLESEEETAASIEVWEREWVEFGFGLWAAELKSTGALTGAIGLSVPTFLPELLPAVEVGWRLGREHWGKGLATEGARASLAFGFDEVGLERIVSICQPENVASWRVMEKVGLRHELESVHPRYGYPLAIWMIDRSSWSAPRSMLQSP